jgi:hypothetical protein
LLAGVAALVLLRRVAARLVRALAALVVVVAAAILLVGPSFALLYVLQQRQLRGEPAIMPMTARDAVRASV